MSKEPSELLGWFGKRKENVVSNGLHTMVISVGDCVRELRQTTACMAESDSAGAMKAIERLIKSEHEVDYMEDDLCNQISIGELGPQEREDLLHIIKKTDTIADWCKEAAIHIRLADAVKIEVPKNIWEMMTEAVQNLESGMNYLSSAIDSMGLKNDNMVSCVRSIKDIERTIDKAYFEINKAIFSSDMDAKGAVIASKIMDSIEMAADTCKSCSDSLTIIHFARVV